MYKRPRWLVQTKRLFPHPLFAGLVSLAMLAVGVLFAGVACNVRDCWPMAFPSVLFFAGCIVTAIAAITHTQKESTYDREETQTNKPTFAILVLLIGVYSWMLTAAMHIFGALFPNGPGTTKYFVTLGIAMAASTFMQVKGRKIIRQHFGLMGANRLVLTARQAVYVFGFVLLLAIYLVWLLK